MSSPRRTTNSRRTFLKSLSTVVAGAAGAPTEALAGPGQQTPAAPDPISADALEIAQQLIGVNLPAGERDNARPLVTRHRDSYDVIRKVTLPSETEPAFSFRIPLPARTGRNHRAASQQARPSRVTSAAVRPPRPRAIEDLAFEPVSTLSELIAARVVSSTELTTMYLQRLKRYDPVLHCVVTLTEDLAVAQATEADQEIKAGRYRGPLHGIPYGIKDLFAVKDVLTTWGAQPYADQVFPYDATAVTRMREAGAVLVAKLSTGELAVGDLWFRDRTRNPWNPERGSSGSSAGPASAASAGLVGFAIGTETGGSNVSPASTCGVVGLRPTYGRVSRFGCMTLRWTLDKVGPITRSVADAAAVLTALHGPDGRDETVPDLPFFWDGARSVKGLRIGYIERELTGPFDAEDRQQVAARRPLLEAAMNVYRQAGATLVPITLPDLPAQALYAILNAEAGAMFDELVRSGRINELTDKGVNGRANQLRATRFIPAVEYIRAQRIRTLLVQQMNTLFDTIDLFLSPSQSESVTMTNLTGHPAMVVPAGFVEGLPIALMLTGRHWGEATLARAGAAFEAATDWHTKHPLLDA
jgi:Asp-tRNA(Asn)/Glu-tRNA(Gln) amidotransferase A subunit family amidase